AVRARSAARAARAPRRPEGSPHGPTAHAEGHRRVADREDVSHLRASGRLRRHAPARGASHRRRGGRARHQRLRPRPQRPAHPRRDRALRSGPVRAVEHVGQRPPGSESARKGRALHARVQAERQAGRHRLVAPEPPAAHRVAGRQAARHHQGHHRQGARPHPLEQLQHQGARPGDPRLGHAIGPERRARRRWGTHSGRRQRAVGAGRRCSRRDRGL
ncbi:MAG: FIG00687691: hypothetical protein, partial [uncultured Acetobacteraceae bacterium]